MTIRKSSDRTEEYICIDSFLQSLKEIDSVQDITYCKETKDPPDFWVTIEGVKYAVEVTSIVNDIDYQALCNRLLKNIQTEFAKSNDMKGTYALSIMRKPNLPKRNTTDWKVLVSAAATRIRQMSNTSGRVEFCLLKDTNGYLEIEKWSDQDAKIGLCAIETGKWEGKVQEEITQRFQERIEAKRERLKDIQLHCSNIILLFYDAYGFGDVEDAQKAFLNVHGYNWLHSIYLAASFSDIPNTLYPTKPGRKGVFLYSRNKQWR